MILPIAILFERVKMPDSKKASHAKQKMQIVQNRSHIPPTPADLASICITN